MNQRAPWGQLVALVAICFLVAGSISAFVVYLVLDSDKAEVAAVEKNTDRSMDAKKLAASVERQQRQLDRRAERLQDRSQTVFAYLKGLKPIDGAPGKDGLPSSIPGEDGTDGQDRARRHRRNRWRRWDQRN